MTTVQPPPPNTQPAAVQPPPPQAAPEPAGRTFSVREQGRNGTVTLTDRGIERVMKRRGFQKDDRQFFPYKSITLVHHDRTRMGSDKVTVHVGLKEYEWKVATDAEGFVDILNARI